MSKYNLFKGKARGSIGDVTFTVLNDTQVAKVRNRHPRNPRTDAQMFQRAVWATIMRIYSAGKSFFSQSFEEATTPQQNMNAFTSLNMQYLRELLTQEIEQQTPINEQLGRVVHPKAGTPIPLPGLIISQGTLQADFFAIRPATETDYITISIPAPISATETIQQYATRVGLSPEIVYTFVVFLNDTTTIVAKVDDIYNDYATQYAAYFDTLQLTCRQDLTDKPMSAATIGDIFDMSSPYNIFTPSVADIAISNDTLPITTILRRNTPTGTFGISAYHTTTQQTTNTTMQPISIINNYGIATQYIENAWFTQYTSKKPIEIIDETPKDYDYRIEYIEADGSQFINTGITAQDVDITVICSITKITSVNIICIYSKLYDWQSLILIAQGTAFQLWTSKGFNPAIVEQKYTIVKNGMNVSAYSDETLITTITIPSINPTRIPLYIAGNGNVFGNCKIFYIKVGDIAEFIPVVKDGEVGLYDNINKKFYKSEGTKEFIAGPKL